MSDIVERLGNPEWDQEEAAMDAKAEIIRLTAEVNKLSVGRDKLLDGIEAARIYQRDMSRARLSEAEQAAAQGDDVRQSLASTEAERHSFAAHQLRRVAEQIRAIWG